jgi:predicted nucleic acid-binding protein
VVLVDTAVWIDWLRAKPTSATARLTALLGDGDAALAPVILQELLQGAASESALRTLRERFEILPMLMPRPGTATYADAGGLYARCRWGGYTPRSPHDCLIAQLAIEHRAPLLHDDRDFAHIAKFEPRLIHWQG